MPEKHGDLFVSRNIKLVNALARHIPFLCVTCGIISIVNKSY